MNSKNKGIRNDIYNNIIRGDGLLGLIKNMFEREASTSVINLPFDKKFHLEERRPEQDL